MRITWLGAFEHVRTLAHVNRKGEITEEKNRIRRQSKKREYGKK